MLIDEITLHLKAGKGGNGVVRWRHDKFREYGGPAGGDGGKGGDIFARAVQDLNVLAKYRSIKEFEAERGEDGKNFSKHGKAGADLILDFPVGSVITNLDSKKTIELARSGETIKLLLGGSRGKGNEHFKSSTNVQPKQHTEGKAGEEADFFIELRLIADMGIIGLPNAGKTSLLNALTHASAKVGSYAFTTLEPNLGDFHGYILADIPGLMEGAAKGRGLGHKFLRHIQRTKALLHCVSLEGDNLFLDYDTVRGELGYYDSSLLQKREIVVFTKSDLAKEEVIAAAEEEFKKQGLETIVVSIEDSASLSLLKSRLSKILLGASRISSA